MFEVVDKGAIKEKQRKLKELGLYEGNVDGIWGPLSQAAWDKTQGDKVVSAPFDTTRIIWATKVSKEFILKVRDIAKRLEMPTEGSNWLMACMAFETGETFSPTIKNGAGAPYYGLIQFGEAAAKDCGTTVAALVKMTAEQQLDYVYKFFKPYTGKLKTLSDVYSRIIWPVAVGKSEDYVIFDTKVRPTAYVQNKGLDINKDGLVTKAECAAKVQEKYVRGLKFVA
jgi:hypothetical protein